MGGDKAMIAIGIGCQRGAKKEAIMRLVRDVVATAGIEDERVALFSIEDKRSEAGLIEAAAALQWPLRFLPRSALRQMATAVVSPSRHAQALFGVTSVSEAAALAGAGHEASLLLPRVAGDGVTCAIARGAER